MILNHSGPLLASSVKWAPGRFGPVRKPLLEEHLQ